MTDIIPAAVLSLKIALFCVSYMTISGLTRRNRRKRIQSVRHDAGMI